MKHIVKTILLVMLFLLITNVVYAENTAGSSAVISYNSTIKNKENRFFIKKLAIKRVLERYDSPLVEATDSFIQACIKHDLDCYLLPSISGLESTFGKYLYPESHNPFGWGGGYIMFNSWDDGIDTVGKGLRNNYINKGATSLNQIGNIYSESATWTQRIQFFINTFNKEEEKLQLILNEKQVQL